jgi:tetratricopeptide (TPR) repeat protein
LNWYARERIFSFDSVFISIALLTLGFVAILTLRDWVATGSPSSKVVQKSLKRVAQLISLQDWEKAEKELLPFLENGKGGKEAYLLEIQILRGRGLLQEALHKTVIQSRVFPEELLFRFEEGEILLKLERAKEAVAAFQVCAPILRGEAPLFSLASALYQCSYPKECLEVLDPLLSSTQNGLIAATAGDALYELKFFPEAIARYTQAIALGCKTHHIFIQLGHACRRFGNLSKAEKIFRGLLEKDLHDIDAALGLGACLQERGLHNKALLIYQAALAKTPQEVRLLHQAASAAFRTKKYLVAENYFLALSQQQEPDPQILSYYGLCLEHQKKWQEAEQIYLKLIQLFPADYQGYRALAWMFGAGLSQTLSQNLGMDCAHRALKLKNDPLSWEILSACAARIGQFDKAYQIQLSLAKQDKDTQTRTRRQQALRTLRKKMPLGNHLIVRTQVA